MLNESNINIFWSSLLIEELRRNGCDFFCICPGSRSTPLTTAVAQNETCESVICFDERSAGFFALGYARARSKPAVVIVTSGTALANLLPAIVEASQDNVPMIVLSADRPYELIDSGANQTIDQARMYGNFARWFTTIAPCPDVDLTRVLSAVDFALFRSLCLKPGPVHINCSFREPLAPTKKLFDKSGSDKFAFWLHSNKPFTTFCGGEVCTSEDELEPVARRISRAEKGLVIVGALKKSSHREAVRNLCMRLRWPVFADVASGLRSGCEGLISHYEHLIAAKKNALSYPDVVLHLGGRLVSKVLQEFLERSQCNSYILLDESPDRLDPGSIITHRLVGNITLTTKCLEKFVGEGSISALNEEYFVMPKKVGQLVENAINSSEILSEPFIARQVLKSLPSGSALFLGNSMPIRDADMFGWQIPNVEIGTNRGASGIDGTISSACGFAKGVGRPTTLLVGDLAFLHDANALSLLSNLKEALTIILINNGGGGIFSFLPIAAHEEIFTPYFDSPHNVKIADLCRAFDLPHLKVTTKAQLQNALEIATGSNQHLVVEAITDRRQNVCFHDQIMGEVISGLEG